MVLPAIQVAAVAAFCVAGLLLPRRDEGLLHADTAINVATGAALAAFKLLVLVGLIAWIDGPGLLPLHRLPIVPQVLIAFLVLDWAKWALHLVHHRVPFFWSFHRVHHSSERLNATAGFRMHVVDFVQLAFLPVLLLSVIFDTTASPAWLVPAVLAPGLVIDAFQHANLRFDVHSPLGRAWDRVLNNPHFHAWHHTADGALCDGNYGNVLTIWDRLFGTCVSQDELPALYGLDDTQKLRNDPLGLQLLRRRSG